MRKCGYRILGLMSSLPSERTFIVAREVLSRIVKKKKEEEKEKSLAVVTVIEMSTV